MTPAAIASAVWAASRIASTLLPSCSMITSDCTCPAGSRSGFGRVKLVERQQRSFHRSLCGLGHIQPADTRAVDNCAHGGGVQRLRPANGRRRGSPHTFEVKLVALAQAHDQHAPGRDLPAWIDYRHLAGLAAQVACSDELTDRPAQRRIERAGRATRLGHAVKEIDDNGIGRCVLYGALLYVYLHHNELPRFLCPRRFPRQDGRQRIGE